MVYCNGRKSPSSRSCNDSRPTSTSASTGAGTSSRRGVASHDIVDVHHLRVRVHERDRTRHVAVHVHHGAAARQQHRVRANVDRVAHGALWVVRARDVHLVERAVGVEACARAACARERRRRRTRAVRRDIDGATRRAGEHVRRGVARGGAPPPTRCTPLRTSSAAPNAARKAGSAASSSVAR